MRQVIFLVLTLLAVHAGAAEKCLPEHFKEQGEYTHINSKKRMKLLKIDEASCWIKVELTMAGKNGALNKIEAWFPADSLSGFY